MDPSMKVTGAGQRSTRSDSIRRILVFLVLTFVLSAVFWVLIVRAGTLEANGGLYTLGLMWCPGIAALITTLLYQRNLRGLGWRLGPPRYLLVSYVLPLGYATLAYGLTWLTGLGAFTAANVPAGQPVPIFVLINATIVFLTGGLLPALGEEIGWRGLLVPELVRLTPFTKTALISGAIWAVWHLPLLLFADYNAGTLAWYALLCFSIMTIGLSFAFAWLRLKSGSLWTAAIMHASHNTFIQGIFDRLTRDTGITPYVTTEFGFALALLAIGVAYWTWRKRAAVSVQ
jgi:membrane protease YdiL (CAAX protease family)